VIAVNFNEKTVNYRGGVVRFVIPSHWVEEYEPEGGGTFYEDRPDSGTLRLNVLEFESSKLAEEMALAALEKDDGPLRDRGATPVVRSILPSGFGMRRYVWPAIEGNEKLHLHRWEVFVPVQPHTLRIVIFVHTILAGQEEYPHIAAELDLLDESIRAAEFSQEAGVAGAFHRDSDV
jgi:hypothetical protein